MTGRHVAALCRAFLAAAAFAALAADAPGPSAITPFSGVAPGNPQPPWHALTLPNIKAPEFALVADVSGTVLRVRATAAAGSLAHAVSVDPAERARLAWRWKVDRVVEAADLARKAGDDYAARVYVFFDVPASELPLAQRGRMKLAKLLYGADLPTAALCYVWDNRHPAGTSAWNAYSDRLRMIVVESGSARVGKWVEAARDVDADFQAAFGATWKKATPRITGVAVAADTDQTGESVTAWFGDLRLEKRP